MESITLNDQRSKREIDNNHASGGYYNAVQFVRLFHNRRRRDAGVSDEEVWLGVLARLCRNHCRQSD